MPGRASADDPDASVQSELAENMPTSPLAPWTKIVFDSLFSCASTVDLKMTFMEQQNAASEISSHASIRFDRAELLISLLSCS